MTHHPVLSRGFENQLRTYLRHRRIAEAHKKSGGAPEEGMNVVNGKCYCRACKDQRETWEEWSQ